MISKHLLKFLGTSIALAVLFVWVPEAIRLRQTHHTGAPEIQAEPDCSYAQAVQRISWPLRIILRQKCSSVTKVSSHNEDNPETPDIDTKSIPIIWGDIFTWFTVKIFTDPLTIFTLGLAFYTVRLVREAKDAGKTAKDTLEHITKSSERELRAYVSLAAASFTIKGHDASFNGEFKNTGATPAHNFQVFGNIHVLDWPLTNLPKGETSEENRSRIPLGPQMSSFSSGTCDVRTEDLNGLRDGKRAVVYYGFARYEDVFKVTRHLHFRYFIGGSRKIKSMSGQFECFPHESGNNDGDEA